MDIKMHGIRLQKNQQRNEDIKKATSIKCSKFFMFWKEAAK